MDEHANRVRSAMSTDTRDGHARQRDARITETQNRRHKHDGSTASPNFIGTLLGTTSVRNIVSLRRDARVIGV